MTDSLLDYVCVHVCVCVCVRGEVSPLLRCRCPPARGEGSGEGRPHPTAGPALHGWAELAVSKISIETNRENKCLGVAGTPT